MATRTVRVDDLDGSEGANPVLFSVDGVSYSIDLSDKNRDKLVKALAPYVEAGRRTTPARKSRGSSSLAEAKAWLKGQGFDVKDRGPLTNEQREAWENRP
jgi:hypothetical protein